MNESGKKPPVISPEDALDTVYRDLVQVHYGLAEHGPTDPKMASSWAMREVRGVLNYIQAIQRARTTSQQG